MPRKITDEVVMELYKKTTLSKHEKFNYDELGEDSKIIYDMLDKIRGVKNEKRT